MSTSGIPHLWWVRDLPAELKGKLVKQAEFSDLKALALVSRLFHGFASRRLFETINIPVQEANLARLGGRPYHGLTRAQPLPTFVTLVKHLGFRAHFHKPRSDRCVHKASSLEDTFISMAQKMMPLMCRLQEGSLTSFTWEMGTCIPGEFLGPEGILIKDQRALKSLSLVTSSGCLQNTIDSRGPPALEGFDSIRNFTWKGIESFRELTTLFHFLTANVHNLEELHLDLTMVEWATWAGVVDLDEASIFVDSALPHTPTGSSIAFSALVSLSLSGIYLPRIGVQMAHAINIGRLRSLKIRHCIDTAEFLYTIVESGQSLQLKEFEIMIQDKMEDNWSNTALISFLQSFTGLERLYIMAEVVVGFLDYGQAIMGHQLTLKSVVYHHMMGRGRMNRSGFHDACIRLGLSPFSEKSYWTELFAAVSFECLGLCDTAYHVWKILECIASHQDLKILHLRRSARDEGEMEEILPHFPVFLAPEDLTLPVPPVPKWDMRDWDEVDWQEQAPDVISLVAWAFSCPELSNLQVLALGDFSYDNRFPRSNMLFCRDTSSSPRYPFRIMDREETEPFKGIVRPWEFLEACPKDTLLWRPRGETEWPGPA